MIYLDTCIFSIVAARVMGSWVIARKELNTLAPITIKNVMAKVPVHSLIASNTLFLVKVRPGKIIINIARKEPIAAACATENQPENMPPNTNPKRITTPNISLIERKRSFQEHFEVGGAMPGHTLHQITTVMMPKPAWSMPGRIPAENSALTELVVSTAYRIIGVLGGIKIPNVPPKAIDPVDRRASYPSLRISGKETAPMVAQVAGVEPQMAPKPAQAAIVAQAKLPGTRESHFLVKSNKPDDSLAR